MKRDPFLPIKKQILFMAAAAIVLGGISCSNVYARPNIKEEYAQKVKREFLFAWNNYRKYAWGHDELKPLTESYFDWYGKGNSLLMTPVDAYDTMVLMGLKKQAEQDEQLIDDSL